MAAKKEAASEPSCEELKAMWRFSKRQSRAAEITNELPMYRDPFTDNVWEPYYATTRSGGGMRTQYQGRPIYGRVIHKAPLLRIHDVAERNRAFEEFARFYGAAPQPQQPEPRRRLTSFRLPGGGFTLQSGSFQHLKDLIKTERARELQQQRLEEEAAARAATLKYLGGAPRGFTSYHDLDYNYDYDGREGQNESGYMDFGGGYPLQDVLMPVSTDSLDNGRYNFDSMAGYARNPPRSTQQVSSYLDSGLFNVDDIDGLVM